MSDVRFPSLPPTSADLGVLLGAAFETDPFYAWLFPTAETRLSGLTEYFTEKLEYSLASGRDVLISPSGNTVLVAYPRPAAPAPEHATASRDIIARYAPPGHLERVLEVFAALPDPAEAHVYLDVIATAPAARGGGEGSALLRRWLQRVGSARVLLDSSSTANLPFYERLGFRALPKLVLPHGAGTMTPMERLPER